MKTTFLLVPVCALALSVATSPSAWADAGLQNGSPGAQGTEGTNPTHQDQNVTGPNGEHTTNTNPANDPPLNHKTKNDSCSSGSCSSSS